MRLVADTPLLLTVVVVVTLPVGTPPEALLTVTLPDGVPVVAGSTEIPVAAGFNPFETVIKLVPLGLVDIRGLLEIELIPCGVRKVCVCPGSLIV